MTAPRAASMFAQPSALRSAPFVAVLPAVLPALLVAALLAALVPLAGCATAPAAIEPPIVVPLEVRNGLPTVTATIGGVPLRLFLDLGAYSAVALTGAELQRVPVRVLPEPIRSTNAAGDIVESRRFVAPDVVLGGVALGDLDGNEFAFPANFAPPDRNGYLGFALHSLFLLVFDYGGGALRLYRTGATDALRRECGTQSFAIDVVNGIAQSTVATGHGTRVFSWDTGSRRSVVRPSVVGQSPGPGSAGTGVATRQIGSFVLGGRELGPQTFVLIDYRGITVDGVLGTDFFATRVVCLDIGRGVGAVR